MRRLICAVTLIGLFAAFSRADDESGRRAAPGAVSTVRLPAPRNEHAETFITPKGKRVAAVTVAPQSWRAGNGYRSVNLTAAAEEFGDFTHAVHAGPYRYRYNRGDKGKGYRFERGDYYVKVTPAGDWTGKRSAAEPKAGGVKETVVVEKGADPVLMWTISTNGRLDLDGGRIICRDAGGAPVFFSAVPEAFDGAGAAVGVTVELDADTLRYRLDIPANAAWPVEVDPSWLVDDSGAATGMTHKNGSYYDIQARNAPSASYAYSSYLKPGQYYNIGNSTHYIQRGFLTFPAADVVPDTAVIDSVTITLVVEGDYSEVDFDITLFKGTFTGAAVDTSWHNDFDGWQTGTQTYTGTTIANTVNTAGISAGDTLSFTFNATTFDTDSPQLKVWFTIEPVNPPDAFTMTALDSATIACSWIDGSDNEELFYIIDWADSTVIDSLAANATADTISGLSTNGKYVWAVVADSAGVQGYSFPDSAWAIPSPTAPGRSCPTPSSRTCTSSPRPPTRSGYSPKRRRMQPPTVRVWRSRRYRATGRPRPAG